MKRFSNAVVLLILSLVILYFHFYKLTHLSFRVWDEARLATSAYEMTKTGNFLVTTLGYTPDIIGTKPPLMIWAQALCIRFFGLTEFSVRLPAAICSTITILISFAFVYKLAKSKWAALVAAIVLCTAQCYLFEHATRYGEYDSMLTLFTTLYLISFFLFTEADTGRRNFYLFLFFFFLAAATLTKGIAALLFAPSMFVYLILRKQMVSVILDRYFYVGVVFFIVLVGSFYVMRELKGPGYLQAVAIQELGGRFNAVIEGHTGTWDFYWAYLKGDGFGNWYWALPASVCLFWFYPNSKLFRATGFFLLTSIGMLVLISFAQTKLKWYVLPAIPLFAIIIGILMGQISEAIAGVLSWNKQIVTIIFISIFSFQPAFEAANMLYYWNDDLGKDNFYASSYYFRQAIEGHRDLHNQIYLAGGYELQCLLYVYRLNDLGVHVPHIAYWENPKFRPGDRVIANFPASKSYIETNYTYQLVEDFYGVRNYLITGVQGH